MRLFYQPSVAQSSSAAFSNPATSALHSSVAVIPAKLLDFKASLKDNKVVLRWAVGENETADQFVVEKSTDGKNFSMAALVFGTDKVATGNYEFYEKAGNHKVSYRIKLVNKNSKTEYSEAVEINPANG